MRSFRCWLLEVRGPIPRRRDKHDLLCHFGCLSISSKSHHIHFGFAGGPIFVKYTPADHRPSVPEMDDRGRRSMEVLRGAGRVMNQFGNIGRRQHVLKGAAAETGPDCNRGPSSTDPYHWDLSHYHSLPMDLIVGASEFILPVAPPPLWSGLAWFGLFPFISRPWTAKRREKSNTSRWKQRQRQQQQESSKQRLET